MRLGVPEALLYYRYEPQIKAFFNNLDVDVVYSGSSNRTILEEGIKNSVDEACLPMKIFQGHVSKLLKSCDKVVVPRIMKCEFGDSICPKFAGLPELIAKGKKDEKFIFTSPIYLNDKNRLKNTLCKQGLEIGLSKSKVISALRESNKGSASHNNFLQDTIHNGIKVAILGHTYNICDTFVNMNIVEKLNRLDVAAISGNTLTLAHVGESVTDLMKDPYWMFYRENLNVAVALAKKNAVDGIIYISSFNCGTDSVIIEMIKSRIRDFPMLVLKTDEHTGEAGMLTRLEAFTELLDRKKRQRIN